MFHVPCSMFNVQYLMFNGQCSIFNIQYLAFNVLCALCTTLCIFKMLCILAVVRSIILQSTTLSYHLISRCIPFRLCFVAFGVFGVFAIFAVFIVFIMYSCEFE